MSRADSYEFIYEMLRKCQGRIPPEGLSDDLDIRDSIGLDSFQIVELLGEMENRLDLEIPDRQIRNLQTIGQISEYLQREA